MRLLLLQYAANALVLFIGALVLGLRFLGRFFPQIGTLVLQLDLFDRGVILSLRLCCFFLILPQLRIVGQIEVLAFVLYHFLLVCLKNLAVGQVALVIHHAVLDGGIIVRGHYAVVVAGFYELGCTFDKRRLAPGLTVPCRLLLRLQLLAAADRGLASFSLFPDQIKFGLRLESALFFDFLLLDFFVLALQLPLLLNNLALSFDERFPLLAGQQLD